MRLTSRSISSRAACCCAVNGACAAGVGAGVLACALPAASAAATNSGSNRSFILRIPSWLIGSDEGDIEIPTLRSHVLARGLHRRHAAQQLHTLLPQRKV